MNHTLKQSLIGVSLALLCAISGCSKSDPESSPAAKAKEKAENAANPSFAVVQEIDEALKKREFESAAARLIEAQAVAGQGMLSDKDAAQVRDSMRDVQSQLAAAAARGDQKAIQAIQMLKLSASGTMRR